MQNLLAVCRCCLLWGVFEMLHVSSRVSRMEWCPFGFAQCVKLNKETGWSAFTLQCTFFHMGKEDSLCYFSQFQSICFLKIRGICSCLQSTEYTRTLIRFSDSSCMTLFFRQRVFFQALLFSAFPLWFSFKQREDKQSKASGQRQDKISVHSVPRWAGISTETF